ncbi:MAG: hypothetical protein M1455_06465 [Actinobacteria bacterium]|nr:hypothetical protein [Actinomycetota bacterium]
MPETIEERVAVLERGMEAVQSELGDCKNTCARWQDDWKTEFSSFRVDLKKDFRGIYERFNTYLPRYITIAGVGAGMVIGGCLTIIGVLIKL